MSEPIILYDIPGNKPEFKAWSPNTWNARFALNFKGLPYKTEWIEYPDIVALANKIGANPTSKKKDGSDYYTLPIIYDPSTKTVVEDSREIAIYLDKTYPDTPTLFPKGTLTLTATFPAALGSQVSTHLFDLVVLGTWKYLNERSQIYFRSTRELDFGIKLEDFVPEGAVGEAKWKAAENGFNTLNAWLNAGGGEGQFITGDQIAFADIILAGRLIWARTVLGRESKEWKVIAGWNGGRWDRFLKSFEKYETIV